VRSAVPRLRTGKEADRRRATEFVAMQLQRYTVKKDNIGFFGPIGWSRLSDRPIGIELRPGRALVDRRRFEGWFIDALADRLNEDPAVRAVDGAGGRPASGVTPRRSTRRSGAPCR
jgi:hypothetical protein